MQCPVCDVPLSISSREGVEIDFCPQCRGVWLDRGELDKVIERASTAMAGAAPRAVGDPDRGRYDDRPRERDRYDDRYRGGDRDRYRRDDSGEHRRYDSGEHRRYSEAEYKKRKKRSFLDDLFDFD
jgi:Zn-finger nucleic acid-binding protein